MRRDSRNVARALTLAAVVLLPATARAQGTAADYERSQGLRTRWQGLVVNLPEQPTWIDSTSRFWYRKSVLGGHQFVVVDATTREKRPAFDHDRLAAGLNAATHRTYTGITLPFNTVAFDSTERRIDVTADSAAWTCDLTEYRCTRAPARAGAGRGGRGGAGGRGAGVPGEPPPPRVSPDKKIEAYIQNFNVFVRPAGARAAGAALSWDGSEGSPYTLQSIEWSPDSKKIAAIRVQPGYQRMVRYVESSPTDQLQPKYMERFYAKPGDVLDTQRPALFNVETKQEIVVDNALFPSAFSLVRLAWRKDGRAFTFEYNQRGHQVYRVIEVDAATGKARALITEQSATFIDYTRASGTLTNSGRTFRADAADGKEIVWLSERDGFAHLYLYDGVTGQVKNQITKGKWMVRGVQHVDEAKRQIYFSAGASRAGQDPYFAQYYRINFDGTGMVPLTDAEANHTVVFSADGQYYVDTWSRLDLAPSSQLRTSADQKVALDLEHSDDSALRAAGWRAPEVFVAKGRDGQTDIWGIIIRPTNFDPARKYPVIENIYAGPQGSFVPKSFFEFHPMNAVAELGFIVVQIDGMGTNNRSRAFHDVAWKNLGDAGFPDRILWHRAIAAKYPWYDTSRVGIYGTSAGGQNSLGALLFHPEFYKAAFSAAGCHDNRMDKIWWNEQWMGWPLGPEYAASSNVDNAPRLQGHLLLVVGELDTNVDPSSTMQVVNALIKANKMFDLLLIPGADHTSGGPYGDRKRDDFFVHTLLGVEPPDRNAVPPVMRSGDRGDDDAAAPSWDEIFARWVEASGVGATGGLR
jgi:dipeptidyl aminopeptidase/acylaminoacyl peptidase